MATIASHSAAYLYDNVHVLRENVHDQEDNVTRLLILTKTGIRGTGSRLYTSIVFDVLDAPAALHESLGAFAKHDIHIIKLESFAPMQRHRDAHFYLECIGNPEKPLLHRALTELATSTKRMSVLGAYNKSSYRRANFEN